MSPLVDDNSKISKKVETTKFFFRKTETTGRQDDRTETMKDRTLQFTDTK